MKLSIPKTLNCSSKVAKKAEITRAFKKFQKSKKGNRIMATKFADAVA